MTKGQLCDYSVKVCEIMKLRMEKTTQLEIIYFEYVLCKGLKGRISFVADN